MLSVGYLSVDCFSLMICGAVLSAVSSLLPQNSLLTGKLTGKMNKNSFHLTFKPQFLLGKDDHSSKINRELFLQEQGKILVKQIVLQVHKTFKSILTICTKASFWLHNIQS